MVHIPDNDTIATKSEYMNYYGSLLPELTLSAHVYNDFGQSVILNDYELFSDKVYHTVMSL